MVESTRDELIDQTAAVVLAGGKGTRLGALTRRVCKPALPFGAVYRNIDFSLSNCVNSGIRHIGVATQHKPEALLGHLDAVWRGRAMVPGHSIAVWPAEACAPWGYRGTADAVFRNLEIIEKSGWRRVLVLAGDHVYKMDYGLLLEYHCARGADVTVGCVEVAVEEAHQFGIVSIDGTGRIDRFVEKPQTVDQLPPNSGHRVLASMGIYVFETAFLARVLKRDARSNHSRHDFGGDILPGILRTSRVFGYPFLDAASGEAAYWRDVGTPMAYWRAHMDLLRPNPPLCLDEPRWPVAGAAEVPVRTSRYAGSGQGVDPALVAPGCKIQGRVCRSVLFSGVAVAPGAEVAESVILPGASIGRHCRLRGVIVDSGCRIPDGLVIERAWPNVSELNGDEPVVLTADNLAESVGSEPDRQMIAGV